MKTNISTSTWYGVSVERAKIGYKVRIQFEGKATSEIPASWSDFATLTVTTLMPVFSQNVGLVLSTGKTMSVSCNPNGTIKINPSEAIPVGEYVQGSFEYYCNG